MRRAVRRPGGQGKTLLALELRQVLQIPPTYERSSMGDGVRGAQRSR